MKENSKNPKRLTFEQPSIPTDNKLRKLLTEYLKHIENHTMTPRLETHYREILFEESVTAYFGPNAWMKINAF